MPGTARRRSLSIAVTVVAALAAPAAAQAASFTVKPGDGPCTASGDAACGSLKEAALTAAPGDVFTVSNAIYQSAEFDVGGVTVVGSPSFAVDGTLTFSGASGGVSKLQNAIITQPNGVNPGVAVGGAGLQISDSAVLSVNGDGALFTGGTENKIVRSVIASGGQLTPALRVTSPDDSPGDKALLVESSILTGGSAGLSVNTGTNGLIIGSNAGDVDVTFHHVTAAGANGVVLDSSKAASNLLGPAVGNIVASATDSIILNGTSMTKYFGLALLSQSNTITKNYDARTLDGNLDPVAVFADPGTRNFRLRAGSPAIDAGGFTPGESTSDVDGQPRPGPKTDLGGDEYVAPPAPPPAPDAPTGTPVKGDGVAPAVVIKSPRANQHVKLTKTTTRIVKKKVKGKTRRIKRKRTRRVPFTIEGTAKDPAGVKGVVVTIQRTSLIKSKKSKKKKKKSKKKSSKKKSAKASQTTTKKAKRCVWLDSKRGIKVRSCENPPLLLAKLDGDGNWSLDIKKSLRILPGRFRIIVLGGDKSGAVGNTASSKDAIHKFAFVRR